MLPQLDITSGAENGHVNPVVFFLVGSIHYFSIYERIAVVKFLGLYQIFIAPHRQKAKPKDSPHRVYTPRVQTDPNKFKCRYCEESYPKH